MNVLRSFCLFILLFPTVIFSQQIIGAKQAAMGYCGVTSTDVFSAFNNPAGLAEIKKLRIATYYENKFLLRELSYRAGCMAFSIDKNKVIGIKLASYGFEFYRRSLVGTDFAMKLSDAINAGVDIDYVDYYFGNEYGSIKRLTFGAGFQAKISHNLNFGVYTFNPFAFKTKVKQQEPLPTLYRIGLEFHHNKFKIVVETEKELLIKSQFKVGIQYKLKETIYIRTGISSNPILNTFGFGYYYKKITCDVACTYHQILGISPQIALHYSFNKNE